MALTLDLLSDYAKTNTGENCRYMLHDRYISNIIFVKSVKCNVLIFIGILLCSFPFPPDLTSLLDYVDILLRNKQKILPFYTYFLAMLVSDDFYLFVHNIFSYVPIWMGWVKYM